MTPTEPKAERMPDIDFGRYSSPSANSFALEELQEAYWAMFREARRAREAEERWHELYRAEFDSIQETGAKWLANVKALDAKFAALEKERDIDRRHANEMETRALRLMRERDEARAEAGRYRLKYFKDGSSAESENRALRAQLEEARAELSALCDAAVEADLVCWGPAYDRVKAPGAAHRLRVLSQPWDKNSERSRAGWKLLDELRASRARVAQLEGALGKYSFHLRGCLRIATTTDMVRDQPPCTCGLDAALHPEPGGESSEGEETP